MLKDILKTLKFEVSNDDQDTRRNFERRQVDKCIAIMDNLSYPVENWSKGGVSLIGDNRQFSVGDFKDITLRFKLSDHIIDVVHKGHILRKGQDKFVLQLTPLTQNIDRKFNHIVDDYVAQEFAQSQN